MYETRPLPTFAFVRVGSFFGSSVGRYPLRRRPPSWGSFPFLEVIRSRPGPTPWPPWGFRRARDRPRQRREPLSFRIRGCDTPAPSPIWFEARRLELVLVSTPE